jgi:regulator of sigma E protease
MTLLVSAVAFFFLITGLILIHELGHFFAARKAGVEVEEFGFGLPPRAKRLFHWKGTDFTLNWIPFGGFVRLKGEGAMEETEKQEQGSFAKAPIIARCIILVAGVAMNFLLAIVIFLYGFSFGQWIPTYLSLEEMQAAADKGEISLRLSVVIEDVLAGGTAESAGIPKGSVLKTIDGQEVKQPEDVVRMQEGKASVSYEFLPSADATESKTATVAVEDGKTGVYLRTLPLELSAPVRGPIEAVMLSLRETKVVTEQTVYGIYQLFKSLVSKGAVPEGVTGIVGIAQLTYTSVQEGFSVYLRLVALLSLSLAVLNILPFPALDGGRLLFVLSELFIKPGNRKVEIITNTVGFAVLLMVILLVTLYDVFRLFI